jgi:hypothetical protein
MTLTLTTFTRRGACVHEFTDIKALDLTYITTGTQYISIYKNESPCIYQQILLREYNVRDFTKMSKL